MMGFRNEVNDDGIQNSQQSRRHTEEKEKEKKKKKRKGAHLTSPPPFIPSHLPTRTQDRERKAVPVLIDPSSSRPNRRYLTLPTHLPRQASVAPGSRMVGVWLVR